MRTIRSLGVEKIWNTSYCNRGHDVLDGKPIAHECHVLPPAALVAEINGDTDRAIAILSQAKPLRSHRGKKPE
jgi:hypothetical protein